MDRIRRSLPAILVFIAMALGIIGSDYAHFAYGGYKGMFMAGAINLMAMERCQLEGDVTVRNHDEEDTKLSLHLSGSVGGDSCETIVECSMISEGQIIGTPIATFKSRDEEAELLIHLNGSDTVIELNELMRGDGELEPLTMDMDRLYASVSVDEAVIDDPRPGYHHLKIKTTRYSLDLTDGLSLIGLSNLERALGTELALENAAAKIYLNDNAEVVRIDLNLFSGKTVVDLMLGIRSF